MEYQLEMEGRGDIWKLNSIAFNSGRESSNKVWMNHRFKGGELLFEKRHITDSLKVCWSGLFNKQLKKKQRVKAYFNSYLIINLSMEQKS